MAHVNKTGLLKLLLLAVTLSASIFGNAVPRHFQAEGIIRVHFFSATGESNKVDTFPFVFQQSGEQWRVFSVQPFGATITILGKKGATAMYVDEHTTKPINTAMIHATDFPVATYYSQVPWFVFGSVAVLQTNRYIPAPWEIPQMGARAHLFRADYLEEGGFIKFAAFVHDPERRQDAKDSDLIHRETQPNEWFSKRVTERLPGTPGQTGGVYYVTHRTNINGFSFPQRFVMENYRENHVGKPGHIGRRFIGIVTNYSFEVAPPKPPEGVTFGVVDFRFSKRDRNIDSIQYKTTELFQVPPDAERILQQKIKAAPLLPPWVRRDLIVYSLLGIFLIAPPVLWLRSGMRTRKATTQNL
ncbi:MAG: hypothetical protein SFY81_13785 [Verrucomicrobiota bacterium]|nr:hypothetical protein [Verrucomicrobiota bacterium]